MGTDREREADFQRFLHPLGDRAVGTPPPLGPVGSLDEELSRIEATYPRRAVGAPPPPTPEPRTRAGQMYWQWLRVTKRITDEDRGYIVAIEREASEQAVPPLDVERLARAIHASGDPHDPVSIAAEYARLGSAPSRSDR